MCIFFLWETNIPFVIQGLLTSFRFLRDAFLRGACLSMLSDNIFDEFGEAGVYICRS